MAVKNKKGLIIGISIAAVVAIAAAITIPLVLMNKGGGEPEQVEFLLSSKIRVAGKTASFELDWTPTDTIRFESFNYVCEPKVTNKVTFKQEGDPRPMPVTITFDNDITVDLKGTLSFAYEDVTTKTKGKSKINVDIPKPVPPVDDSWTISLDDTSKDFGDLTDGDEQTGESITIENYIGENEAEISFVPEDGYEWAMFTITASDTRGSTLEATYAPAEFETLSTITITNSSGVFENDDVVTLHFELQTWTISLDDASKDFGDLSADGQTGKSVTIKEYIGLNSATISFIPESGYDSIDFTVTAQNARGSVFDEVSYAPGTTTSVGISFEGTGEDDKFKDEDVVTLHFEEPTVTHTLTYHFQNGTNPDQSDERIETQTYGPTDPTVDPGWIPEYGDYDFDNWVVIDEETQSEIPYNFGEVLTEDLHIYARYTVTLNATYNYSDNFTPVTNRATMDARNLSSFSMQKFSPDESYEIKPIINPKKVIRFLSFVFYNKPAGQEDLPLEEASQLDFTDISKNFKVELNSTELVYETDYDMTVLTGNHPINIIFTKTGLSKLTQDANLVVTMMPTPAP